MDRIVIMASPVKAPMIMIYKDGITEQMGGINNDNLVSVAREIVEREGIQHIDLYGPSTYTEKFGTQIFEETRKYNTAIYYNF